MARKLKNFQWKEANKNYAKKKMVFLCRQRRQRRILIGFGFVKHLLIQKLKITKQKNWIKIESSPESNLHQLLQAESSRQKPITWGEFVSLSMRNMIKHPMETTIWYPTGALRMGRPLKVIHGYLTHYIPAYFLDLFAFASRIFKFSNISAIYLDVT